MDTILISFVSAIAAGTFAYFLGTTLGWSRDIVGILWLIIAMAAVGGYFRARRQQSSGVAAVHTSDAGNARSRSVLWGIAVLVVVVGAFVDRLDAGNWWLWWSLITCGGAVALWLSLRTPEEQLPAQPEPHGRLAHVAPVHVIAACFAVFSAITRRSDADDVFLVNRAVWTSQHDGPFAQRDTLFANQVFPRTGPDFPDRAYEQLVGVLSAWTNVSAATWFYLILGPLVAGLSVWAMWRLLMCLGVRAPAVATGAAALFLVLDGGSHAGLGNFSFVRSWQGKSVLLLIVLPVLMCAGLRWGRHGRGVDLWVMLVASVAAIGLSSSSLFLVPIAAGISVVAGVCDATESRGVRVGALLIPVAPQALVALGTFIADPQPLLAMPPHLGFALWPTPSELTVAPWSVWSKVFGSGVAMAVGAAALVLAPLGVARRSGAVLLSLLSLVCFGGLYAPGVLHMLDDVSGAGSVLWRVGWLLQIPVAVGIVVAMWHRRMRRLRSAWHTMVPVVMLLSLLGGDTWVFDEDNVDGVGWPALDLPGTSEASARMILDHALPGDVVASTHSRNWAVGALDSRVFTVNPRGRYIGQLRPHPEYYADERVLVTRVINDGLASTSPGDFLQALDVLSVDVVCAVVGDAATEVSDVLTPNGWQVVDADDVCVVIRRQSDPTP